MTSACPELLRRCSEMPTRETVAASTDCLSKIRVLGFGFSTLRRTQQLAFASSSVESLLESADAKSSGLGG